MKHITATMTKSVLSRIEPFHLFQLTGRQSNITFIKFTFQNESARLVSWIKEKSSLEGVRDRDLTLNR